MRSGFKMKGYSYAGKSPVPQKYDMEKNQTADNSGPVKPVNQTVASNTRVDKQEELVNDLEDKIQFIKTDVENKKVSKKEAKKTIAGYRAKIANLNSQANAQSNKKRSDAERALEAKEDAMGL